jgi:hypothetical protein
LGLDLNRAADAVGDEAALVGAVVKRLDLGTVEIAVESDRGRKTTRVNLLPFMVPSGSSSYEITRTRSPRARARNQSM